MVGLFRLATGRLVRFALETWKTHEIPLARQLIAWLQPGEIVLADRGFCGWGLIALLQRKGVDVVMPSADFVASCIRLFALGKGDTAIGQMKF
jgi:hypothetical protein